MLNTPNEWHNEEEIDEDYADEEYVEDEYSDEEGEEYEDEYEDEEYEEDSEDGGDGGDNDGLKKKLIIASAILLIFLVLMGVIFGAKSILSKKSAGVTTVESTDIVATGDEEGGLNIEDSDGLGADASAETSESGEEVSIDVETDEAVAKGTEATTTIEEEGGLSVAAGEGESNANKLNTDTESGLQIEVDEGPAAKTFAGKPGDETVTIAIGDVGRKNPFVPIGKIGTIDVSMQAKTQDNDGVDFDAIEPPDLGPERADIAKLLQTKVTGILYDTIKPSAIINIDGADQLIRIGDVLSGFEIIAITRNKVVIRSDNNVYRASVGQPLNAERVVNPVEISNLETKFWGSTKH